MFQTNGLCHDLCTPQGFVYAITQSNSCWCSNYTPAKSAQVATSKCSLGCPGYPDEKCGGPGVYGYVFLNVAQPSGTKGAGSSTTSEVSPQVSFHCPAYLYFPFARVYSVLNFTCRFLHPSVIQVISPCMTLSFTPRRATFCNTLSTFLAVLHAINQVLLVVLSCLCKSRYIASGVSGKANPHLCLFQANLMVLVTETGQGTPSSTSTPSSSPMTSSSSISSSSSSSSSISSTVGPHPPPPHQSKFHAPDHTPNHPPLPTISPDPNGRPPRPRVR